MFQKFHRLLGSVVLACASVCAAHAAEPAYPDKPIKLIVPYAPGGTADVMARLLGDNLGKRLGQVVIVDNRPGAGTAIGTKAAALATPDGYTLLFGGVSSQVMNPLINSVPFDPLTSFDPISMVNSLPLVLIAKHDLPVHNFAEFIALAKSKPGSISYASAGAGTSNHLAGELLNKEAGIKMRHIPYKGSAPALNDVLGGQVDVMFDLVLTSAPQIRQSKVTALATTGAERSALLPDVPTLRELGIANGEVDVWQAIFAPKGVPPDILARLNKEIVSILKQPEVQERFAKYGAKAVSSTPEQLDRVVRTDMEKWGQIVKAAGISTDK